MCGLIEYCFCGAPFVCRRIIVDCYEDKGKGRHAKRGVPRALSMLLVLDRCMSDRHDRFAELMEEPGNNREAELVTSFLKETETAVDAIFKGQALQVAADYDRFRRQALEQHNNPHYATFFNTLSDTIKRFHPP